MDVRDVVHEELLFTWESVSGETNSRWQQERGPRRLSPSYGMTKRENPGECQDVEEWRAPLLAHSIRMTQSEWPLNQHGVAVFNKAIDHRENKANGANHGITVSHKKMVSIIVSIFKGRKLGWAHLVSSQQLNPGPRTPSQGWKPVLPAVSQGCFRPDWPSQTDPKLHYKIQEREIGNKIGASPTILIPCSFNNYWG